MVLREALKTFAQSMEIELRKNEFRGNWGEHDPEEMMAKLWDEVYDLDDQVEAYMNGNGDKDKILKEAVDVANYAMFVADIVMASMGDKE